MKVGRFLRLLFAPDLSKEPERIFEGYDGQRREVTDHDLMDDYVEYDWPERPREALFRRVKIDTFARWAARPVDSMYNDKYGPRGFPVGKEIKKRRKN